MMTNVFVLSNRQSKHIVHFFQFRIRWARPRPAESIAVSVGSLLQLVLHIFRLASAKEAKNLRITPLGMPSREAGHEQ